jgi:hypothetical protein
MRDIATHIYFICRATKMQKKYFSIESALHCATLRSNMKNKPTKQASPQRRNFSLRFPVSLCERAEAIARSRAPYRPIVAPIYFEAINIGLKVLEEREQASCRTSRAK